MALNVSSLLRRWHSHFVLSHPPPLHCVAHLWLQIVKSTVSDTGEEIWCLTVKHSNGDSVAPNSDACLCHFWLQICFFVIFANYITIWKMMNITVKVMFWQMPFETLLYMLLAHCPDCIPLNSLRGNSGKQKLSLYAVYVLYCIPYHRQSAVCISLMCHLCNTAVLCIIESGEWVSANLSYKMASFINDT